MEATAIAGNCAGQLIFGTDLGGCAAGDVNSNAE